MVNLKHSKLEVVFQYNSD